MQIGIYVRLFFLSLKNRFSTSRSKTHSVKIKQIWSGEIERETDLKLIRTYHMERCKACDFPSVDDATWSDLSMDEIFRKIDRCTSLIGSQYLYHLLHKYESDHEKLDRRYNEYHTFLNDKTLREKIQKPLLRLNRTGACYLVDLLFSDLPERPPYCFLFVASSLLLLLFIITTFFHGVFIFAVLVFGITNLLIHLLYTPKIAGYIPDLSFLSHMLGIVSSLSKIDDAPQLSELRCLRDHCRSAAELNKKIGWLIVDKNMLHEIYASIYEYFNHFFLMDLIIFLISLNEIKRAQKSLIEMYENIASLDASISVSSYLQSISRYCKPVFNENNVIEVADVFHPLLEAPVPNSFSIGNKSCLITGSNMAGKTTFIKTIGINILLARTLNICLAESADLPKVQVKTSIKRQDDLNNNKSYYYREIESILEFINLSKNDDNYIFLIDEIFRGTNTNERLSSATAVLKYLSRRNINLVTTHDMELQDFLKGRFEMYHFMEQIENQEHFFDFLIKPGPCHSRNAIKLLEIRGYPDCIVQDALELSKNLSALNT